MVLVDEENGHHSFGNRRKSSKKRFEAGSFLDIKMSRKFIQQLDDQ
jgi:hypothetical protein